MVYNHRRTMIDICEHRRQIIEKRYERNRSAFAKALGFSRTAISEYAGGTKTIGNRVADRLDRAIGLPPGWLDNAAQHPRKPTRLLPRGRPARNRPSPRAA